MALRPQQIADIEFHIIGILEALGEDPYREGLKDTPKRVAKLYSDILDGHTSSIDHRITSFEEEENTGNQVMVHHVPFYAFCEHHMSLFHGHFGMAYVPKKKVLGISKLVRIFRHTCKKLTMQERITHQSVKLLQQYADTEDAIAYVKAEHTCMTLRGVKSPGSFTTTICGEGIYRSSGDLRTQFINEASK